MVAMKTLALLAYGLLVLLGLSISAQGLQMSESINSYGIIEYSAHAQSVVIKRYTSTYSFAGIDAETVAELFDMCQIWGTSASAEKIEQIKEIRPDFIALLYRNTRDIYNYSDEWQMALDNDWILKDENGQLVYTTIYPTDYFADIGNPQYQQWVANWIKEKIDQYGFDGVFADNSLAAWASEYFWGKSATPINPRTGAPWTDEECRQALIQLHREIKNAIGSQLLACNGIYEGSRFWRRYDGYTEILSNSPLDGIMSEGLLYAKNGIWRSEAQWLDCLNLLVWVQNNFLKDHPNRVFVPVSTASGVTLPAGCTSEQLALYGFASTLLGVNNSQNYLILAHPDDPLSFINFVQDLHNINVGFPINDYYLIAGTHVYARDFSNVKVLVNPTSNSYPIDLQGTFKTLDGEIVTEVTMEDHTGIILVKIL